MAGSLRRRQLRLAAQSWKMTRRGVRVVRMELSEGERRADNQSARVSARHGRALARPALPSPSPHLPKIAFGRGRGSAEGATKHPVSRSAILGGEVFAILSTDRDQHPAQGAATAARRISLTRSRSLTTSSAGTWTTR